MKVLAVALLLVVGLQAQTVTVHSASPAYMPLPVDSNSPVFWSGGMVHVLGSVGYVNRMSGWTPWTLEFEEPVTVLFEEPKSVWIEAAWQDADGTLFAWYHHEPVGLCPDNSLTAPKIGALVSYDDGLTFEDLGIVMETGHALECDAKNGFFAGGHGDFSVVLNPADGHFYFFFSNYSGSLANQGIAVARMHQDDRWTPIGKVFKYAAGAWESPGLGGEAEALFPAVRPWEEADTDAFWGPSVHWNTHLKKFVMLISRTCCEPQWPQAGIHVSFAADLADPAGWTKPKLILEDPGFRPGWYPQVIGTRFGETDTLAGHTARLFIHGVSRWELTFEP